MEENMTDFQFRKILEMVKKILLGCDSLDEAIKAIDDLIDEKKSN